jgi:hypothetical protein
MNAATNLIAIQDHEINKQAVGRIVFWQLAGSVNRTRLAETLHNASTAATPPEEVSPGVAVHRAVETVARANSGEARQLTRGVWAIVGKGEAQETGTTLGSIAYAVKSKARVAPLPSGIAVEGEHEAALVNAFAEAKAALSPQDVSVWLTKQLELLGAVALRETGGFYFVPQDVIFAWEEIATAVKLASSHKLYAVPALKSQDALDAILGAVTLDTQAACAEASRDLGTLGKRGLATREGELSALVQRASRYEAILGKKLDTLRVAIEETRASVATAMFALGSEESE